MLMIRLQRVGRKHEPAFRLVLTDSKNSTKSGKFLEILGNYDSRRGEKSEFKSDRISYWMSQGAQTSDTVHNLLIDKKIIEGKKINKLPKKKAIVKSPEAVEKTKDGREEEKQASGDAVIAEETATENERVPASGDESVNEVVEEVSAPIEEVVI